TTLQLVLPRAHVKQQYCTSITPYTRTEGRMRHGVQHNDGMPSVLFRHGSQNHEGTITNTGTGMVVCQPGGRFGRVGCTPGGAPPYGVERNRSALYECLRIARCPVVDDWSGRGNTCKFGSLAWTGLALTTLAGIHTYTHTHV